MARSFAVPITLLALLGSVACQSGGYAPTTSPPAIPPSPSPSSPNMISYPPSQSPPSLNPPTYPPSPSQPTIPQPSSPSSPVAYPPSQKSIVREAVKNATDNNRGTGAGLIRLFFHDCFVEGCDASVLLNTTASTEPTERASAPNLSLRGFEVIDAAKAALEAACPGIVSCADIVAFAGRDATYFLSGNVVDFDMPAGRYDGRVSLGSEALANLPPPFASLQELKDKFAAKGLDTEDMVTLSGAHTVGRSHCSSFSDRLPPNTSDMNATLLARLIPQCNSSGDPTVPQDFETPNDLDRQYYRNVLNHEVLFASDAALLASNQTAVMVKANALTPGLWEAKFQAAMVKMGRAGIKTSTDGEIRKKCWMVN
ncbi:Peroxidase 2 [Dichanthelium oligosanthes]|uniref:Peroxidase n=1 Tax=Dichanthelium oligosanthes TaxID=888268 RepID=A0A1E5VCH5_9POAL|nr:Peroxidase 2 [Dichanthelium oligosanthes]